MSEIISTAPDTLDVAWAQRWVDLAATRISEQRVELSELDRLIGDGDHGENLARGFAAVRTALGQAQPQTVGDVLKLVATTLMSTVGGASGPLYGTAFLRAAKIGSSSSVTAEAVHTMLDAALEGVVARGRAHVGEKTMVDAWTPAVAAAEAAVAGGSGAADVLTAAADAAEEGSRATEPMIASKGRASYLGERSAGHRDPGSVSTALLLRAAADAAHSGGAETGGSQPEGARSAGAQGEASDVA